MMWDKKKKHKKKTTGEAEVIESGERNNSDLRRELGRLFVLLSNSLRNLHGCLSTRLCTPRGKDYAFISPRNEAFEVFHRVCGQFVFC